MTDNGLISFKEMCAKFDVTPRTLRYYEYIELIQPHKVDRTRFYGPREVARMTLILRGRRFGFSLEEMRQWLLIYEEKGIRQQMQVTVEMADRQAKVLAQQIEELQTARAELLLLREKAAAELEMPNHTTVPQEITNSS